MGRLFGICIFSALCGVIFLASETPWVIWRLYDLLLLLFVSRTWYFVLHMRGLSLVDERLAQVDELQRSATKYWEIAELLPHVVWTATADGTVDFSNQRWHEYSAADSWTSAIHPEEIARRWERGSRPSRRERPCDLKCGWKVGPAIAPSFSRRHRSPMGTR